MSRSIVALPTGQKINPSEPTKSELWQGWNNGEGVTMYIIQDSRTALRKAFTSFGCILDLGSCYEFKHDQTCRSLGIFTVVGIRTAESIVGQHPTKNLAHWVAK